MLNISVDDLSSDEVANLLALHLTGMRGSSPPGHSFALDLSELKSDDITVWSASEGEKVVGIGALKEHGGGLGEIKSMRTHPDFLRRGVGSALLDHIIDVARAKGLDRLSLETGKGQPFEAALAMYEKRGFRNGDSFADYVPSGFSQFLHLDLSAPEPDLRVEEDNGDPGQLAPKRYQQVG